MREPGGTYRPALFSADAEITVFGIRRKLGGFQGIFLALFIAGLYRHHAFTVHFEHFQLRAAFTRLYIICLLYTSDAADEMSEV